jgi:thymidylate synthase (FAD)
MKIDVLDKGFVELLESMGNDSTIAESARISHLGKYKSDEADAKLIRNLITSGHTSPLEQVEFRFLVKAPIYVARQWMRHRTWCLSGDTEITFNRPDRWNRGMHTKQSPFFEDGFTIKELYRKWKKSEHSKNIISSMLLRVYDEKEKKFTISNIKNILYSGKKEVYKVSTQSGKNIKCSKDHLFLTGEGWMTLEKALGLGLTNSNLAYMTDNSAFFLTNGEQLYQNKEWLSNQKTLGKSVQDMADEAGCGYYTIRKYLKRYNLQFDPLQNLAGVNGKPVWNKGVYGYKLNTIFSEEAKENIRKARAGEKSNFWKGGVTSDRARIAGWANSVAKSVHAKNNYTCQRCNKVGGKLHAHHIMPVVDYPEKAYDIKNLTTLCENCHKEIHNNKENNRSKNGTPLLAKLEQIVSIEYIGIEDTYDIEVEGEHHNFVANGFVVHNSYSEVSRRYTSKDMDFYVPQFDSEDAKHAYEQSVFISLNAYNKLIEESVRKEQARGVLPTCLYTTFYAKTDLHNLFHFLELRLGKGAQYEIVEYANAICKLIEPIAPITMQIWLEKYNVVK